MKFTDLGLSAPLLQAITEKGYTSPSPVQEKAIPLVLAGHDLKFTGPLSEVLRRREADDRG